MPIGSFLDSFPSILYVTAHLAFLGAGLWAWKKLSGRSFAQALWLYAASQVFFLAFFGGVLTMKMAVLIEQTLMVVMVLWIATRGASPEKSSANEGIAALAHK